jgi:quercetin dioxygenase-like cupin family protein
MKRIFQLPIPILLFALALGLAERGRAALFEPTAVAQTDDGQWVEEYTFTLYPGESVPWHYHAGWLAIIVTSGSLTEDRGCGAPLETHGAGAAFTEAPGVVHSVVNNGATPVVLLISGVMPSCYGGYNDILFIDAPRCEGASGRSHIERVPACG